MSFTVRGTCAVFWKPAFTLTVESPDGTELDADGKVHPLIATLTKTLTGLPIPGRRLKLKTSPVGEVGHNVRGLTNTDGEVTFAVSDEDDETVQYTVSLVPNPPSSQPTLTATESIQWGGGPMAFIESDLSPGSGFNTSPQNDEIVCTTNVAVGELIVIVHHYGNGATGNVSTVTAASITDTVGTTYQEAVAFTPGGGFGVNTTRIFYGITTAAGANTITVPISSSTATLDDRIMAAVRYTNPNASPLVDTSTATAASAGGAQVTRSAGSVSTIQDGVVISLHQCNASGGVVTAGPAGTNPTAAILESQSFFKVTDLVDCVTGTASSEVNCKMNAYFGAAASFKP